MAADKIASALRVLKAHKIDIHDPDYPLEEFREIGRLGSDEIVYSTSLKAIFGNSAGSADGEFSEPIDDVADDFDLSDDRLEPWFNRLRSIVENAAQSRAFRDVHRESQGPEPHCAWYCPIHFYGYGWGIYIREDCILHDALAIATWVDWTAPQIAAMSFSERVRRLWRASFYSFFLHEQFHHKVESLGFRLLVASGRDAYRPYKFNVYNPTFGSATCIEESLANADSFRRLGEDRYRQRLGLPFRDGLRRHLKASFLAQPPGYREGLNYLPTSKFQPALFELQSRVKDGRLKPKTSPAHWEVSPNVIESLMNIDEEIYIVIPRGARPLFPVTWVDPRPGISTSAMVNILEKHWGCTVQPGGKGSHVKLHTTTGEMIILTGNQHVLAPKIVVQAMRKVMGGQVNLSDLDAFCVGRRRR